MMEKFDQFKVLSGGYKVSCNTPNLFKKLTGIASTVLKKEYVKKPFPIGHGPYKISKTSSNRIFLSFNGGPSPRFDEIEFRSIKSNADIGQEQFHDFNQMPSRKNFIPDTSKSNFYDVPSLKVYSIVINLPTTKERQCVKKLLVAGQWQQSYGLSVIPQQSFLPWRIQQEAWLPKNITCAQTRKKIPFLIADIYDSKAVSDEFSKIGATKYFDIISLPGADFAKWAFSGKPYVAMMSFDSSSSIASLDGDFSFYFESFFMKQNRIVTNPVPRLKNIIQEATRFDISPKERESKIRAAENLLLKRGWLLPIGRLDRKIIFPENIKIEEWADKLNGFPAIWTIR